MKLKVDNQIPDVKIFYMFEGQPKEHQKRFRNKKNNTIWFARSIYKYML